MKKCFKILFLFILSLLVYNTKSYASSIPSSFSVDMPIPSWYRRNEKLIDQANSAINILLLAHYGIDKDPRQKEIAERGMRAVLASERDWPSAVIAFKEIEKSINEDYEKALKTRKNIPLHQSNKDDLVKIKRQFGVK